ncbi:MAG: hypothetical protein QM492_12695 [Rhodobacterales bacterium]
MTYGVLQRNCGLSAAIFIATFCFSVITAFSATYAQSTAGTAISSGFVVDGFRSAKFGMNNADVLAAIKSDFGASGADVIASQNVAERTKILSVIVPEVLPEGGTAQVSYIFGYKSKKLIQVGVSWSKSTDPKITSEILSADGEVLRSHFLSEGFEPETIKTGLVLDAGVILFRGSDKQGRTALLILQGSFKDDGTNGKKLEPKGLALLYSVNPNSPDVFKVDVGSF